MRKTIHKAFDIPIKIARNELEVIIDKNNLFKERTNDKQSIKCKRKHTRNVFRGES